MNAFFLLKAKVGGPIISESNVLFVSLRYYQNISVRNVGWAHVTSIVSSLAIEFCLAIDDFHIKEIVVISCAQSKTLSNFNRQQQPNVPFYIQEGVHNMTSACPSLLPNVCLLLFAFNVC